MVFISDQLEQHKRYFIVADKACKVGSYGGKVFKVAQLEKFGQVRPLFWGLAAIRDIPTKLPKALSLNSSLPVSTRATLLIVVSFRVCFLTKNFLKLCNWVRPTAWMRQAHGWINKQTPRFIIYFCLNSLYGTMQDWRRGDFRFKDCLSVVDDVAELVCTPFEWGYYPLFPNSKMVSDTAGLVSGCASLLKNII